MRPRHKAAENRRRRLALGGAAVLASMRPRHKAAENLLPVPMPNRPLPPLQ